MSKRDAALGIIYLLTNETKQWTKVGRTSAGTAQGRASSYGQVHGQKWTVVTQLATLRVEEVEANIHHALHAKRVNTDTRAKEIFNVMPTAALEIAQGMIVPPTGTHDERQAAISRHAAKVRQRLKAQASFVRGRANRSRSILNTGGTDAVRRLVAPQLLSIDAWEKGVMPEVLLAQHRAIMEQRDAEAARLEKLGEEYDRRLHAAYEAARKAQSWWAMLRGKPLTHGEQIGPRPNTELDAEQFPDVPSYARILIHHEYYQERQRADRAKLLTEDTAKLKRR